MALPQNQSILRLWVTALLVSTAVAQSSSGGQQCGPWWNPHTCQPSDSCGAPSGGSSSSGGNAAAAAKQPTQAQIEYTTRLVTAHVIMACLCWAFFVPIGGIILRIGIKSPHLLHIHAFIQCFSYVMYIAAVGIGIWLVKELSYGGYSLWDDPHTRLGIAILVLAFLQPILGHVHHVIFVRRRDNAKLGIPTKPPGRTIPGHAHLWIGRLCIVLGIINGGLGMRIGAKSPHAKNPGAKTIGYSVAAGIMFAIYAFIMIRFEIQKAKRDKAAATQARHRPKKHQDIDFEDGQPPSNYNSSQESLAKPERTVRRLRED